jgi:hypothetical protein
MYARLIAATFCCALGCLPVAGVEPSPEGALVVYLTGNPAYSSHLRREAESLLQSAGYSLEWRDSTTRQAVDAPNLVVVEFAGDCGAPLTPSATAATLDSGRPLASAAVQDGVVLPFTRIDCAAVRGALAPFVNREAPARRAHFYGRAIGRLIAHELYHVLAQTRDHSLSGVAKTCFTPADLVAERFEFETVALSRLRRPVADPIPADTWDFIGRQ